MGFEKAQRVNARTALFTDGRALFGFAYRHFLEHGGE
jgi:hypothetical protein